MARKMRMGMAGGGEGAFIGAVHRTASRMDDNFELVCGAFCSTRTKSNETGRNLRLPPERVYGTYRDMFRKDGLLKGED